MKITQALLLSILLSFTAHASIEMTTVEPIPGRFSMDIPKGFTRIADDMLKSEASSEDGPSIAYSNESNTVNIIITHPQMPLDDDNMGLMKSIMLMGMRSYQPQAKEVMVDNKKAYIFDFVTHDEKVDTQNMMLMIPFDGRALLIVFNISKEEKEKYMGIGRSSLMSLQFK
ncbi:hypothetical protein [Limnobaculum xujianqingii]|uniref:hypothetical protein n=1 Tax=Limnobaculum xujianqingii TaxID=2738837 RepID=UPI00112AB28A|nr:hypothetical protein [Limnobaculum xujianqingii]